MLSYNCTFALLKVLLSIDLLHFLVCKVPALILYQRESRYWSVKFAFTLCLGRHFISDICPSLSPHITGLPLEHWGPIIKGEASRIQLFCPWASQKSKHKAFQATTDLFSISLVFHFPECYIVGIIQYVAFPDWLYSLSNIYLSFLCLFMTWYLIFIIK